MPIGLVLWLFAFMCAEVPPWHHAWRRERLDVTHVRYVEIAVDIAVVATEAPIDPPPEVRQLGVTSTEWTALLLAETAVAESALRADVVDCHTAGDGGAIPAWTTFGLALPKRAVCGSRREAARVAREMLRTSLETCRRLPVEERLAWYLSGHCDRGQKESKRRWRQFSKWLKLGESVTTDTDT